MKKQSGLTLIEIMVALAIVSMLMIAAMTTMASVLRIHAMSRDTSENSPLAASWRPVLSMDLLNAAEIAPTQTGFSLRTFACLNHTTMEAARLTAEIAYDVRSIRGRRWLVRRQQSQFDGTFAELVCPNVASIKLAPVETPETSVEGASTLPAACTVTLNFSDGRAPWKATFRRE